MRKNLTSAMLYETEIDMIQTLADNTEFPRSEIVSYLVRKGLKDLKWNIDTITKELTELVATAYSIEYRKTPQFQEEVEKELAERQAKVNK